MFVVLLLPAAGCLVYAFCRPRGAFKFAVFAILAAITLPFVVGYGLSPFVGEGAGIGIAFLLYAFAALTASLAVGATVGASLRHGWNALR